MYKNILAAFLFLLVSTSSNANLIKPLEGKYNITGTAEIIIDADGKVTSLDIATMILSNITGDFVNFIPQDPLFIDYSNDRLGLDVDTLTFDRVIDFAGLVFEPLRMLSNVTIDLPNGSITSFSLVGALSAQGYATTETEWFFSSQNLVRGDSNPGLMSFSGFVEAPANIPEPNVIALVLLAAGGLFASRKKAS